MQIQISPSRLFWRSLNPMKTLIFRRSLWRVSCVCILALWTARKTDQEIPSFSSCEWKTRRALGSTPISLHIEGLQRRSNDYDQSRENWISIQRRSNLAISLNVWKIEKFLNDRSTSNIWRTSTHELKVFALRATHLRLSIHRRYYSALSSQAHLLLYCNTSPHPPLWRWWIKARLRKNCLNTLSMEVRSESRRRVLRNKKF